MLGSRALLHLELSTSCHYSVEEEIQRASPTPELGNENAGGVCEWLGSRGTVARPTGFLRFGLRPSLRKPVDIESGKAIQGRRSSHSEWAIKWKSGRVATSKNSSAPSLEKGTYPRSSSTSSSCFATWVRNRFNYRCSRSSTICVTNAVALQKPTLRPWVQPAKH